MGKPADAERASYAEACKFRGPATVFLLRTCYAPRRKPSLTPRHEKKLEILYLRPLDLSVDETMHEILDAVQKIGAKPDGAGTPLPRGLSRIAIPDDNRFDRSRGDDSKHG